MFKVAVEDDEDRHYVERGLGDFLAIDKSASGILKKMVTNSTSLLRAIANRNNLDYIIVRVPTESLPKLKRDCIGLMDCLTEEGGHWCSFYYVHAEDRFILYDSSFDYDSFEHDNEFFDYLSSYSDNVDFAGIDYKSENPLVKRAGMIRRWNITRQPLSFSSDTCHASQHHFCLAESLMFLEELLGDIPESKCMTPRESLIVAKKYVVGVAERLKYPLPPEFFYIWDQRGPSAL